MPCYALIDFYEQIAKRQRLEINHLNWSAALSAAISQTKDGQKIDPLPWLPFLDDKKGLSISPAALALIKANRDKLPPQMLVDLHKYGVLEK